MKHLLKNTKESCNKEEKQEEDDLLQLIKFENLLYYFLERLNNDFTI